MGDVSPKKCSTCSSSYVTVTESGQTDPDLLVSTIYPTDDPITKSSTPYAFNNVTVAQSTVPTDPPTDPESVSKKAFRGGIEVIPFVTPGMYFIPGPDLIYTEALMHHLLLRRGKITPYPKSTI